MASLGIFGSTSQMNKRRQSDYKIHLCLQLVKSKSEFESSIFGEIFYYIYFKNLFLWITVDLQCCINFYCIAKRFSFIYTLLYLVIYIGFPGGSVVKNPSAKAGNVIDSGSSSGLGRSLAIGNGNNPLQCSCLENSMDRESWRATVNEV